MSNLEDIVPPLELCLKIPFPKKNFRDSLFAWVPRFKGKGEWREIVRYELYLRPTNNDSQCIPAPTLQEIFAEFDAEGLCCPSARFDSDTWTVYWIDNPVNEIWCAHELDKNPVTAALKLWLEVNKLDRTDKTNKTDNGMVRNNTEETEETDGTEDKNA